LHFALNTKDTFQRKEVETIYRGRRNIRLSPQRINKRQQDKLDNMQRFNDLAFCRLQYSVFVLWFEKHRKMEVFEKIMESLDAAS